MTRRRRRRTFDPYATALASTGTSRIVHAAVPGTCPRCLVDYPKGTPIMDGRDGWGHALCDEGDF